MRKILHAAVKTLSSLKASKLETINIGVLTSKKQPNLPISTHNALIGVFESAKKHKVDMFTFTLDDVDVGKQTINATRYDENGIGYISEVNYPHIIDNSIAVNNSDVYKSLRKNAVFTRDFTSLLDKSAKYQEEQIKESEFGYLLIPHVKLAEFDYIIDALNKYEEGIIVKPVYGSLGQDVVLLKKVGSKYYLRDNEHSEQLSCDELVEYYNNIWKTKAYVIQPFRESVSRNNEPFDIRLYAKRGADGKFKTARYARIGKAGDLTSNLDSDRGGVPEVDVCGYLKINFGKFSEQIIDKLDYITDNFPEWYQSLYTNKLFDIGVDLGIVRRETGFDIVMFEINIAAVSAAVVPQLNAETTLGYYRYLYNNSRMCDMAIDIKDFQSNLKSNRTLANLKPRFIEENGVYNNPNSASSGVAKIMCVGDLMGEPKMQEAAFFEDIFNFRGSFRLIKNVFKKADLVIGNLETMVAPSYAYAMEKHVITVDKKYRLNPKYHCNAPVEYLDALRYAGFDMFAMSNNHNLDCGIDGIEETLSNVKKYGFGNTGLFAAKQNKRYLISNVNGIKLAILSYSTWFNEYEDDLTKEEQETFINIYSPDRVKRDIVEAKKDGAEFALVYIHWGTESEYSHKVGNKQKEIAQEIADAGADYIVGTHPHALQNYDTIKSSDERNVPVAYSLGNFHTSDGNWITRKNIILCFSLLKEGNKVKITDEYYIPCYVANKYDGNCYPIIPAIGEFNGGLKDKFLSDWRSEAIGIIGAKIKEIETKEASNKKTNNEPNDNKNTKQDKGYAISSTEGAAAALATGKALSSRQNEPEMRLKKLEVMLNEIYEHVEIPSKKCDICNSEFRFWSLYDTSRRYSRWVACPNCGSAERQRLLWHYMNKCNIFDKEQELKLLHFAPEKCFYDVFSSNPKIDYYPVDFNPDYPNIRQVVDIMDIPYEDNFFDLIICIHVMETVPDDIKGFSELARVLKPNGTAFVMSSIYENTLEKTYENPTVTTGEQRLKHYGNMFYARKYGKDFWERINRGGMNVERIPYYHDLPHDIRLAYGLREFDYIYKCTKN